RVRPRYPRPDVLAGARPAQLAGAGQAPPHHPDPVAGPARRRPRPGGRPARTPLPPSLALRGGVPALAFGTPGGDQQEQWQLCFWLAHTVRGLDLQAAIDAPAWPTTSFPSSLHPRDI